MLYRAYCMGLPHDWENFDQAPAGRHHVFFDHDEDSDTPVHEALAIELAVRWNVPVCSCRSATCSTRPSWCTTPSWLPL
jgi:hypothetical protein